MTTKTIDGWRPAQVAWADFAAAHPALGLAGTPWSWIHFCRVHGEKMTAAGAVIRTQNRRWIAHPEKFPEIVLSIALTGNLPAAHRPRSRRSS